MYKNIAIGVLAVALAFTAYAYFGQVARFGQLPRVDTGNAATFTFSATQPVFTLGPITAATSSVTSTVALSRGLVDGLTIGDPCDVLLSTATTSQGFSADAYITAIGNRNATVTVTYFSGLAAGNLTIGTGTLHLRCSYF